MISRGLIGCRSSHPRCHFSSVPGVKFSTTTSAWAISQRRMSWPSGWRRLSVTGGCEKLNIAFLSAATNNLYLQAGIRGAKDAAAAVGADIKVFDANWSPTTQFNQAQNVLTFGLAQIECHRLLVTGIDPPVQGPAGLAVARAAAQRIAGSGLFHLDDLGAEVAEQGGAEWSGDQRANIKDSNA